VHSFHSNFSNATYLLNTNLLNQSSAQAFCNSQGGHLVSYARQYEQLEVENHYSSLVGGSAGLLLPQCVLTRRGLPR
jgi:hypothetical protein